MKKILIPSISFLLFLFNAVNAQLQPIDYQLKFYSHGSAFSWEANSKEAYRGKVKDTIRSHYQDDSLALHIPFNGKIDSVKFTISKAYDRAAHITSFDFIIVRKEGKASIFSLNGVFSEDQISMIRNLKRGNELLFRNIKCEDDKDGSVRSLAPLAVWIE